MKDNIKPSDSKSASTTLPAENSGTADKQAGVISRMQSVKSAWDKAPEGAKKADALRHYQSAEKSQKSGNDAEALRELDEATRALT
ncbi:MAG: hypothetical protein FP825_03655 [Hyphomonas sp.]|uniref:hypothetical protein n=1 Tax=Hyphomonas sp. TaxID=87 RepID=UPI0017E8D6DC|nr:hypothetical protein [Hyphomonas sp.]MBA3067562.1 hypothetical protein [Hyphomonas sp.]MBU3920106.1 hypothetical protein [Alphaproteobacteria bacterium]MBU4063451.1 hypothetical protein [Alphaproteobacteria bacterium]MBU4165272.1 hypothetical protein [Alphaproteobacteria bacterium]